MVFGDIVQTLFIETGKILKYVNIIIDYYFWPLLTFIDKNRSTEDMKSYRFGTI